MASSREDEKDRREDERARLRDLWEAMGPDGYFSEFIRKPTLAQVTACVAELDRKGKWDEETAGELLDLLLARFPELAKKQKSAAAKKPEKKEPAGCLGLIILTALITVASIAAKLA